MSAAPPVLSAPWPEELTESELMALDPGPAAFLPRPDVLVVGGGALGVATALSCVRAGLGRVLLAERTRLASGASGGAAGLLTPEAHHAVDPPDFVALARAGLDGWHRLHAETPGGVGVVDTDWIGLEPHPPAFAADLPPGVAHLNSEDVARLLPALREPVPGVLVRQARVNPVRALARLAGMSPARPAVVTGVTAEALSVSGGRVASVTTTAGTVSPGAVVFATGGPPNLTGLDLHVPSDHVKGHLILTAPTGLRWPGSVAPLATAVSGDRLMIGGSLDVGDSSAEVRMEIVELMRQYLESFIGPHRLAPTSHAWCCFRPAHPDHLPVIDRVPGLENAWLTSGHYRTGIVMAPAAGQVIAAWIADGQRPAGLTGFGADRFEGSTA